MYKHVVAMARELGREVLTEGTESEFHVKVLKENNCEFAQGYYFDKPLMVDEFEKRLVIRRYI
jgi:EAL domain-containing protein (putative c-di-GMP-specific phosphodiesterase class I)